MEWLLALVLALVVGLGGWTSFRPRLRIPTGPRGPAYWVPCFPAPFYLPVPSDPQSLPRAILHVAQQAQQGPLGKIPLPQGISLVHEILYWSLALHRQTADQVLIPMGRSRASDLEGGLASLLNEEGPSFIAGLTVVTAYGVAPLETASRRMGLLDHPGANQDLERLGLLLGYLVRDAVEHDALLGPGRKGS